MPNTLVDQLDCLYETTVGDSHTGDHTIEIRVWRNEVEGILEFGNVR